MTFKTNRYLFLYTIISGLIGVVIMIAGILNFDETNTSQVNSIVPIMLFTILLFFGLPYYFHRSTKEFMQLEPHNGSWILTYPAKKKTIILDKNTIREVSITYNVSIYETPITYTSVVFKFYDDLPILVSSLQTKNFDGFVKLLSADFNDRMTYLDHGK